MLNVLVLQLWPLLSQALKVGLAQLLLLLLVLVKLKALPLLLMLLASLEVATGFVAAVALVRWLLERM